MGRDANLLYLFNPDTCTGLNGRDNLQGVAYRYVQDMYLIPTFLMTVEWALKLQETQIKKKELRQFTTALLMPLVKMVLLITAQISCKCHYIYRKRELGIFITGAVHFKGPQCKKTVGSAILNYCDMLLLLQEYWIKCCPFSICLNFNFVSEDIVINKVQEILPAGNQIQKEKQGK